MSIDARQRLAGSGMNAAVGKLRGSPRGWLARLGWPLLAALTLAVAIAPGLIPLPLPQDAAVLEHASYFPGNGAARDVTLPHAVAFGTSHIPRLDRYEFNLKLPTAASDDLFVFIPSTNRNITLNLNDQTVYTSKVHSVWSGPLYRTSILARLPASILKTGTNRLTATVELGPYLIPAYLSKFYVGTEAALAGPFRLWSYLGGDLKNMALSAHAIITLGLIFAAFFRPKDPLFTWLAAFIGANLIFAVGMAIGWRESFKIASFIAAVAAPASGLLFIGVALAVINIQPPKALRVCIAAISGAILLLLPFDSAPVRSILALGGVTVFVVSLLTGIALMIWSAIRDRNIDARLLLPPSLLLIWILLRDAYVIATVPLHGFDLLLPYVRPIYLTFLMVVLMRRMGESLDRLDRSNENLNAKLAEREAELDALHRREQAEVARLVRERTTHRVREHERQRLTHDLHDGISGHLASIIALSERTGDKPTEQAAREALNDLRLVIYSLDLGDRELPLALANLRERLSPQLQRLGIELDWSTAALPEISGVTPGNALAVLRIMQEAITNALRHGPARKIVVRAGTAADGSAAIIVENDGQAFVETNGGHGLANMRRRARELQGSLTVEATEIGTKVTLLLPCTLPALQDEEEVA